MFYKCLQCQCHSALLCNVKGLKDKNYSSPKYGKSKVEVPFKSPKP